MQGVIRTYDPQTREGVVMRDTDRDLTSVILVRGDSKIASGTSDSTMRPSCMTCTRCATCWAKPMAWVTTTIV